jgi:hypothetical protein
LRRNRFGASAVSAAGGKFANDNDLAIGNRRAGNGRGTENRIFHGSRR